MSGPVHDSLLSILDAAHNTVHTLYIVLRNVKNVPSEVADIRREAALVSHLLEQICNTKPSKPFLLQFRPILEQMANTLSKDADRFIAKLTKSNVDLTRMKLVMWAWYLPEAKNLVWELKEFHATTSAAYSILPVDTLQIMATAYLAPILQTLHYHGTEVSNVVKLALPAHARIPATNKAGVSKQTLSREDVDIISTIEEILAASDTRLPEHLRKHKLALEQICDSTDPSPFEACVRHMHDMSPGPNALSDAILCTLLRLRDEKKIQGRTLMKYSAAIGAVPSTLFVHYVACTDEEKMIPQGYGAYADVFRGRIPGVQEVALKRLRLSVHDDVSLKEWKRPFFREALLWRQLKHPRILDFLGLDEVTFPSRICMVSPWMDNGDLSSYLKRQRDIDDGQRYGWIRDVMEGLAYLHRQSVIHGDLRGANILLDDTLRACIADFGLSTFIDTGLLSMGFSTKHEGAIRWMAPEVIESGVCDTKGDVYSFGCVCLEIVSGKAPFPELRTDRQVSMAVAVSKQQPLWPEHIPAVGSDAAELKELIRRCWSTNPKDRPSMGSVVNLLSQVAPSFQLRTNGANIEQLTLGMRLPMSIQAYLSQGCDSGDLSDLLAELGLGQGVRVITHGRLRCSRICQCQCHGRSGHLDIVPQAARPPIGDIHASVASAVCTCDDPLCVGLRATMAMVKLYLPVWCAEINSGIRVWSSPIQIVIQTPRTAQSVHTCMKFYEIHWKMATRKLTVNDVSDRGMSLLHELMIQAMVADDFHDACNMVQYAIESGARTDWEWNGLTPAQLCVRESALNGLQRKQDLVTLDRTILKPLFGESADDLWEDVCRASGWTDIDSVIMKPSTRRNAPTILAIMLQQPRYHPQLNTRDRYGQGPLGRALRFCPDAMEVLLRAGADPRSDCTTVDDAVYHSSIRSVTMLIRAGADINGPASSFWHSALHTCVFMIQDVNYILALLRHGSHLLDWEYRDADTLTPLDAVTQMMAQQSRYVDLPSIAELCRTRKLPINAQFIGKNDLVGATEAVTRLESTSLIAAARSGKIIPVIGELIGLGAMINERDHAGRTLLHLAAMGVVPNGYRVVLELLRHGGLGIYWAALTVDGETAEELAEETLRILEWTDGTASETCAEATRIRELIRRRRLPDGEEYIYPCMHPDFCHTCFNRPCIGFCEETFNEPHDSG